MKKLIIPCIRFFHWKCEDRKRPERSLLRKIESIWLTDMREKKEMKIIVEF